ncbi:RidA family protein [Pelagibacteraceae bacterium]|jgi:enamine deaminase RidA (YjgF/YER057c/UK114 family)|nr:RidA family protein [Pelagibacteraceae bacterium]|tara:strand:- start:39 stop:500 length:462 start_codon:yes stop_codon:yes gene_type:complete
MSADQNLKDLNIQLPEAPKPVGAYAAYKKIGKLIFISGQVSFRDTGELIKGKVGLDLTLEQGQDAAKACAINILSQIKSACDGDLNKVKNCIKITGFVNSIDSFVEQPKIINAASDLLVKIFGEKGIHARAAVSVNSLPLGASVEIEAIFEID